MSTQFGFCLDRPTWKLRVGIDTADFSWLPTENESGESYPAQLFNAHGDRYVEWVFLWIKIFFAKVTL